MQIQTSPRLTPPVRCNLPESRSDIYLANQAAHTPLIQSSLTHHMCHEPFFNSKQQAIALQERSKTILCMVDRLGHGIIHWGVSAYADGRDWSEFLAGRNFHLMRGSGLTPNLGKSINHHRNLSCHEIIYSEKTTRSWDQGT